MNPATVLQMIGIAEQLAVIINDEITASNSQQEQVAWTAAQQFYLQGLDALKAKVAAQAAQSNANQG